MTPENTSRGYTCEGVLSQDDFREIIDGMQAEGYMSTLSVSAKGLTINVNLTQKAPPIKRTLRPNYASQ